MYVSHLTNPAIGDDAIERQSLEHQIRRMDVLPSGDRKCQPNKERQLVNPFEQLNFGLDFHSECSSDGHHQIHGINLRERPPPGGNIRHIHIQISKPSQTLKELQTVPMPKTRFFSNSTGLFFGYPRSTSTIKPFHQEKSVFFPSSRPAVDMEAFVDPLGDFINRVISNRFTTHMPPPWADFDRFWAEANKNITSRRFRNRFHRGSLLSSPGITSVNTIAPWCVFDIHHRNLYEPVKACNSKVEQRNQKMRFLSHFSTPPKTVCRYETSDSNNETVRSTLNSFQQRDISPKHATVYTTIKNIQLPMSSEKANNSLSIQQRNNHISNKPNTEISFNKLNVAKTLNDEPNLTLPTSSVTDFPDSTCLRKEQQRVFERQALSFTGMQRRQNLFNSNDQKPESIKCDENPYAMQSVSNLVSRYSDGLLPQQIKKCDLVVKPRPKNVAYRSDDEMPTSPTDSVLFRQDITKASPGLAKSEEENRGSSETPRHRDKHSIKSLSAAKQGEEVSKPNNIVNVPTVSPASEVIPRFYFPRGQASSEDIIFDEMRFDKVRELSDSRKSKTFTFSEFPDIMKALDLPLYWKSAFFRAAGPAKKQSVSVDCLATLWSRLVNEHHDDASRLFFLLSCNRNKEFLEPCDWDILVKDVVNTHPGLRFLKEAKDFISRYCKTVIARIYFTVNRTLSDHLTLKELRQSNLVQVINELEFEDDINKFKDYFSYEHFYVIYCKFWEIDTDHDLFISKEDLYRHNQNVISRRVIDRIFAGAISRSAEIKDGRMSYYEFVWFLIAEEDKRSRSSIEYWFRCLDVDGDGYLSMYELEYFYEEQIQRMEMFGYEFMQFEDVMCQMIDMLKPADTTKIRLMDLKKCKLVNVFFDTFINVEKHLEHEQRDPFTSFKDPEISEISDWVRFATEEYANLMEEEQVHSNSDEMPAEDDEFRDESSTNLSMGCNEDDHHHHHHNLHEDNDKQQTPSHYGHKALELVNSSNL